MDYKDLLYAPSSGYKLEKICLEGTWQGIIDEIGAWAWNSSSGKQILWLKGLAGTGKSSIAHTIGKQFDEQHHLGSFFCFDISSKPPRAPEHLFPTIAVNLAGFDNYWNTALWNVIKNDPSLCTTDSVQRQFGEFFLKPADSLRVVGPILIIIDALDECGDASSRKILLEMLATRMSTLPGNFKLLVTSHPEKDIVSAFENCSHICSKDMDNIEPKETQNDVFTYFQVHLKDHKSEFDKIWPDWCDQLAKKSEGLFQWASTACLFITDLFVMPIDQLNLVLGKFKSESLNELYSQIVTRAFPKEQGRDQLKTILGTLFVAKEALTISEVIAVIALIPDIPSKVIKQILQHLGSLFRGVSGDAAAVVPLHTSLLYACCFWASHLGCIEVKNDILVELEKFVQTRLLYWLEVLSLTSRVPEAISSLQIAATWAKNAHSASILSDMQQFISTFWRPINESVGHIYLSALAFCPENSAVLNNYSAHFGNKIKLISNRHINWSGSLNVFQGHAKYVLSVAFSPDGTKIVSVSDDMTIRLWDAATGKSIGSPFEGHTDTIISVAFSPDGTQVVSGSDDNTIRLWDAAIDTPTEPSPNVNSPQSDSLNMSAPPSGLPESPLTGRF
ncbi:hypothetical protein BDZ94DRAFT_1306882 [Collybia nuda]|uniref:Nephrocystin 3-like N-terminal domain-containing protein n=1 Tax=Collybia nuda TaxID=64659 RepID=A0A9P5YBW9_9AGAR|nr:hypothetical protein BDZ94DRAFT_1306882 [Collybia nuda]